eukprot:SAG31_NODE_4633_length_3083_cov_5.088807_8_plen_74_part_00
MMPETARKKGKGWDRRVISRMISYMYRPRMPHAPPRRRAGRGRAGGRGMNPADDRSTVRSKLDIVVMQWPTSL